MSMSDYRRPADYQIRVVAKCDQCNHEDEYSSDFTEGRCSCGGTLSRIGESYPANAQDWDESRDNVNDEFRNERHSGYRSRYDRS